MESKELTLTSVFWEKEKLFWKRIKTLTQSKENFLSKFLAILGICFCRYGATIMHFLFECFMFITNKEQFEKNLKILYYKAKAVDENLKSV